MTGHIIVGSLTIFMLFIMFLVISKTSNNIINLLIKMEYLLQKEFDLKKEALEVRRIMDEQVQEQDERNAARQGL